MSDEAPDSATSEPAPPAGPGLGQAIRYSLLWALWMTVAAGMFLVFIKLLGFNWPFTMNLCLTLGYAFASAFMFRRIIKNSAGAWRSYFPIHRVNVRWIVFAVVAGAAIVFGVVALARLLPFYDQIRLHLTANDFRPAVLVLLVRGVVGPIFEELMFRGWVLFGFMNRYTPRRAIVFSSLIFGLLHLNPVMIAYAFPFGCLCAWMVKRTGSLLPAIVSHIIVNTAAATLGIIYSR